MYPVANWLLASLFLTGGFRGLIEGETHPEPPRVRPDFVKTGSSISVKRSDDLNDFDIEATVNLAK